MESEEAQVIRAQRDPAAFGPLYDRYVDQVYQFTYRRVKNHATAEEITALVFHRALEHLGGFEWRGFPFGAGLVRIAANLVHDHNGHVQRHISLSEWAESGADMAADDLSIEEQCTARQTADVLWQAVATLPMVQQQILVLRFAREMSIHEIAHTMRRTEGAVKQLLFRAVKRLRQRLQQRGFGNEP
ncbi:MAG: sigma-70 family RNA polymerase sigma factor [Nitrospinae bacterium]|nr:sigma-70 family RNA polymerase sigma factor [Nitrospinota bacterium]